MLLRQECRCLVAAVMMLSLRAASAQDQDNITTIDLSSPDLLYDRTITVPRVPSLGLLIPNGTRIMIPNILDMNCNSGAVCSYSLDVPTSGDSLMMEVRRGNMFKTVTFAIDDKYKAGCKNFIFPINATAADATDTLDPVTLVCEPVGVLSVDLSGATLMWQQFTNETEMDGYIDNCTNSCSESCTSTTAFAVTGSEFVNISGNSLTINNPSSNHSWFVPTFQKQDCTYVAPPTYLYRWPRILSRYEFSLEVQERATNYTGLSCEADSFPPTTTIQWLRAGETFTSERYTFSNISERGQLTINGGVTISDVLYEDSEEFTCRAVHPASMPSVPDTSLTVRLRVRDRLRPLWPALGIVGVGIVVALFIIIGHFVDKAIEKSQTDPINPGHHKRLQSITSTMLESENSSNNLVPGKHSSQAKSSGGHGAVKRLSSARLQLLEESQA